jgi:hypothetical protein
MFISDEKPNTREIRTKKKERSKRRRSKTREEDGGY